MRRLMPLLLCLATAAPLWAEDVPASLAMLDGWTTATGKRIVAMKIALDPGWKTYWRSPGDAGVPPRIDWAEGTNLATAGIVWPMPTIYDEAGLRTIGYKHEVVLPLELTPREAGRPMDVKGVLTIGVCKDVCIPLEIPFDMEAAGKGGPNPQIVAALKRQPKVIPAADLPAMACTVDPIPDGVHLTARLTLPNQGDPEAAVFEHSDAGLWVSEARIARQGETLTVGADMVPPDGQPFALDRSGLRLTVIGSKGAVEIDGCPAG